ncbi:MAG: AI-2E family transporter [Pseudomonadota bacterium]
MDANGLHQKTFLLLLVLVTAAFAGVLLPFFNAVFWAMVLAIVFLPLQERLLRRLGPRRNLAALLTLAACVLVVILPLALVISLLAHEAALAYEAIQSGRVNIDDWLRQGIAALPDSLARLLSRHGYADLASLGDKLARLATQGSRFITGQAVAIGQNTVNFLTSLLLMLYLLFFLLRDGAGIALHIRKALPLQSTYKQRLLEKFTAVVRATIKGNFVVAGLQGALGGMIFAVLGIQGAALWGAVMAFLSLLPAIGAALVWGPAALVFLLTGEIGKGVTLILFGMGVIGLIDNLLRPLLVGKDTRMPDYVVLVSTLGGLALFGPTGFIIGPVIAALFISTWDLFASASEQPSSGP